MSSQDSPFFKEQTPSDGWVYFSTLDKHTWRVDQCGLYEEFITVPLAMLEPSEPDTYKNQARIDKYARQYLSGSQFPPISVRGLETGHTTYQVLNGHHRRLAALKAQAPTLDAWTNFYVEYSGKMIPSGESFTASHCALLCDTLEGRKLERILGRTHCPCCGHFLNWNGETCSCCYLGFAHSQQRHMQATGATGTDVMPKA